MNSFDHIDVDDELRLEVLHASLARQLHEVVEENRHYLAQTLPWAEETSTLDDTREFIGLRRRVFEHGRAIPLAIIYRGDIVGGLGMDVVDPEIRCGELGYWLDEDHQGMGLMTRSVSALLDVAFGAWRMHRIEVHTTPQNSPSVRVAERLGFVLEGTKRQAGMLAGRRVDLLLFSLLAEDWHNR